MLPIWIELHAERRGASFVAAALVLYPRTIERDTGQRMATRVHRALPAWSGEADVIAFVRESVREVYLHEADEALTVDGRRLFDPHGVP